MGNKHYFYGSLHNHTDYSNIRLRDSINRYEDLIDYAIQLGHEVVAITDHECISNAVKVEKYYKKIKEKNPNFKVVLGNEIYLCRNGLNADNFITGEDRYWHFILLAKDAIGHQQIREISTRAWQRSYISRRLRRVPTYYQDLFDIIGANPGHVIGSTACLGGLLASQLLSYKKDNHTDEFYGRIINWCLGLQKLFGKENFYFEMQPSDSKEQIYVNNEIVKLSELLDIPFIITTDSHYLKKEEAPIHEAFLNSQEGDREVKSFYATTYLMDTEELESYMQISENNLQKAYQNILNIKNMCEDYSLLKPLKIPQLKWKEPKLKEIAPDWFEKMPYLKTFYNSEFIGDKVLARAIIERMQEDKTLQNEETYYEVNDNLKITWISSEVNKTHWSSYFLNLQNIIDICWQAGSLVGPGRGSGVGFILLYILEITQISPLRETTKTFSWRFLNPNRVSVLDVDFDIEGSRRGKVLKAFRDYYGEDRVANVATFGTEKSKSAILTAARGLGIDNDISQYLSSLIPSDRGMTRTLKQCYYGDEESGFAPIKQFVHEMDNNYPELWEVAQKIEGLVCRIGVHAGGVIFVDEPFTNSTALMRAPDNTIITQFDLHDCEDVSLIKYDALSVEAMDKIHNCIDLICDYGYAERKPTLKETYESLIGVYNLNRTDLNMWKMVWNQEIRSLFQMEQQSGIQGIALTKPKSVDDLATLNSVIRLMAQEKGAEQPLSKYARFKEDISLWYKEMEQYGLTQEEQKLLEPIVKISYGICESQERFMQLVQMPECGGFDLTWADKLRKSIAKKNPAEYEKLQKEYFQNMEEKGLSKNLCNYVWNVLVATSRGYGFNLSHTLAYSLIALQEMNLAYNFPIIFWNCACLISDSGGNSEEEEIIETDENDEESNEDEEVDEEVEEKTTTKKKKQATVDYGKIATAIGQMKSAGIVVSPPDINKSLFTFVPDVENNTIIYGIKGISGIGNDLVAEIIAGRPYSSLNDFQSRIKLSKPKMVNLIKSGAFDNLNPDRTECMKEYIDSITDKKATLNLRNMQMLINYNLLPKELEYEIKVFNFNKYLKAHKNKDYDVYLIDETAHNFYREHYDEDLLYYEEITCGRSDLVISQKDWDKIYKKEMDTVRDYIKENLSDLLYKVNKKNYDELWNKYCKGTISKWEMDSVSFYSHEHELAHLLKNTYNFSNFYELSEEPEVDYKFTTNDGKEIPIFKLNRIAGTVLDKNKNKNSVTLLTTNGVVNVKIYRAQFAKYDKQISQKMPDGTKKVLEKSWFSRGNKLVFSGIRRGNDFVPKKYKNSQYEVIELITDISDDGVLTLENERVEVE